MRGSWHREDTPCRSAVSAGHRAGSSGDGTERLRVPQLQPPSWRGGHGPSVARGWEMGKCTVTLRVSHPVLSPKLRCSPCPFFPSGYLPLRGRMGWMFLEVFSNLNDSMMGRKVYGQEREEENIWRCRLSLPHTSIELDKAE